MGETIQATRPIPRAHGHRIIICSNSQSKPHGRVLEPKRRTKDFVSWILSSSSLSCSFESTHWNRAFFYLNRKPAHVDSDSRQCCQLVGRLETMTSRPESIDFLLYSTFSALMSPIERRAVHFSNFKKSHSFSAVQFDRQVTFRRFSFFKKSRRSATAPKMNSQQTALNKENMRKKRVWRFISLCEYHHNNVVNILRW